MGTNELNRNYINVSNNLVLLQMKNIFFELKKLYSHVKIPGAHCVHKWVANEFTLFIAPWALLLPVWTTSQNLNFWILMPKPLLCPVWVHCLTIWVRSKPDVSTSWWAPSMHSITHYDALEARWHNLPKIT